MVRGIYTIRDEVSLLYMALQLNENSAVAIRNFDYAMSKNDMMNFRPEDFSLWYLGEYDDVTGIVSSVPPQIIKRGAKKGAKHNV